VNSHETEPESVDENAETQRFDPKALNKQRNEAHRKQKEAIALLIDLKRRTHEALGKFLIIPHCPPQEFVMNLLRQEDIRDLSRGIPPEKLRAFLERNKITASVYAGSKDELKVRVQKGELAGKILGFHDKSEPVNAVLFTEKDRTYVFAFASAITKCMTLIFFGS
jgi:hypothetical protein